MAKCCPTLAPIALRPHSARRPLTCQRVFVSVQVPVAHLLRPGGEPGLGQHCTQGSVRGCGLGPGCAQRQPACNARVRGCTQGCALSSPRAAPACLGVHKDGDRYVREEEGHRQEVERPARHRADRRDALPAQSLVGKCRVAGGRGNCAVLESKEDPTRSSRAQQAADIGAVFRMQTPFFVTPPSNMDRKVVVSEAMQPPCSHPTSLPRRFAQAYKPFTKRPFQLHRRGRTWHLTARGIAHPPTEVPRLDSQLDDELSSRPLELDPAGYFIIRVDWEAREIVAGAQPAGRAAGDRAPPPPWHAAEHCSQGSPAVRRLTLVQAPVCVRLCNRFPRSVFVPVPCRLLHQHHQQKRWATAHSAAEQSRTAACQHLKHAL